MDNAIHASVMGTVEITNKLIIVNPLKSKYNPQVGDIVVGRVHEVCIGLCRLPTRDGRLISRLPHLLFCRSIQPIFRNSVRRISRISSI